MTDLPNGWEWTTVGQITDAIHKTNPKEAPDEAFTYVDIGSIDNSRQRIDNPKTVLGREAPTRARQCLCAGDTVFSTVRTYLRNIGFVADDLDGAIGSTGFSVLRPSSGIIPKYLYYHSLTSAFIDDLSSQMRGTSYPAVVDRQVREMAIPIAPTNEQKRIVAAIEEQFSRLDAGMAALEQIRVKLMRMRSAVLEAAVQGQLPDLTETAAQSPSKWSVVTVGDIAEVSGGITKNPKRHPHLNPVPFLRVANVQRDGLQLQDVHNVEVYEGELDRLRLQQGDLLVVEGNGSPDQIGRSAVWDGSIDPCVHQNHLIRVRPGKEVIPEYLNLFWNAPSSMKVIQGAASSTTGLHTLSTGKVRSIPVLLPPFAEQQSIVQEVERHKSFIDVAESQIARATLRCRWLRSSILAAAFSGQLVPQDSKDEPASLLLERLSAERASLNGTEPTRTRKSQSPGKKIAG